MTPFTILNAVRMGQAALRAEHKALDILWKKFGLSVRACRKSRGITPRQFAKSLGVTTAMLGMMEMGKRSWQMDRAEKAAKLLKRPVQWPDAGRERV